MATRSKETYFERDKALYNAYKEALKKIYDSYDADSPEAKMTHQRAIREALKTQQSRFWITQDRTYRVLSGLLHKGKPKTWNTRIKMYQELLETYNRLIQKRMFKDMPLIFVASFVTFEPSSGFFMSLSRAGRTINRMRKLEMLSRHAKKI